VDVSLVLFIVVVAFFAYRGYQKGLLRSLSRIFSLLAGYTASILFTEQVSALLTSQFQLQGMVSFIAAALGLFIAGGIAVSIVFHLIEKLLPVSETPSTASSCGGLATGLMVGAIVAITAVWAFTFVRDFSGSTALDKLAPSEQSKIETMANRIAGKAVTTAMSLGSVNPEVIRISAAIIEAPADISLHAQQLISSGDLQALLSDPRNQSVLDSGDVKALQQLPAFQQLVNNPDFLALAKAAGMLSDDAAGDRPPETILATRMIEIWERMQRVKNDARVQKILSDPQFQQNVQSGNPLDLLTDPRLLELANIIFTDPVAADPAVDKDS
jgi:uncharacterized membrane protein required for colicin V production